MKPATSLTFVVVSLISAVHLLRVIFGVHVVVGAVSIPVWPSGLATVFFAALAVGLWRERRVVRP